MEGFIILPNDLIWNSENMDNTYLHYYGDKILHVFSFLDGYTNRFGKTVFTIKEMIESCDLIPKSGKGKTNSQFKDILIDLQAKNIIETTLDLNTVKIYDYISCIFNMPLVKDSQGNNTKFFNIPHKNYFRIMNEYNGALNKLNLLKTYYYICARLSRRENIMINGEAMSNDIVVHGGKSECFYDKYECIIKDLKLTETAWYSCIKVLNELDLLYFDNIGMVAKNGRKYTANNVYCIDKNEIDEALEQSRLYYLDNKYTILDKKTEKTIRVANGLKGKIKQEESLNKDTSKLKNKLTNIELSIKKEKCVIV